MHGVSGFGGQHADLAPPHPKGHPSRCDGTPRVAPPWARRGMGAGIGMREVQGRTCLPAPQCRLVGQRAAPARQDRATGRLLSGHRLRPRLLLRPPAAACGPIAGQIRALQASYQVLLSQATDQTRSRTVGASSGPPSLGPAMPSRRPRPFRRPSGRATDGWCASDVTLTGRLRCGLLLSRRAQASRTATISPAIRLGQASISLLRCEVLT